MHDDNHIIVSEKVKPISPFLVMEIMEKATAIEKQGGKVIHLEVGEPDFDTPACIKEAAIKALGKGQTKYSHSLGLPELREAICESYLKNYEVSIHPDQIIVTSGTSPAMFLWFSLMLNPGDEVILSDPHYACYPNFIRFMGGQPVLVKIYEKEGFQYQPSKIKEKIRAKTKGIIINSPANPTGTLLTPEVMKKIAVLDSWIISDEIYHGLVYEGKAHSILEYTDKAVVINGFSKLYAMTGWRLGYLIAPKKLIRPMQIIQQNFFISASSFVQYAGLAALKEAQADVEKMVKIYDQRREFMIQGLRRLGFGISVEPTGAFYILANAKSFCPDNSFHFCLDVLEKAGLAITPGIDFGENAEGYVRFSYANSIENIAEGLDRLKHYLKTR